MQQTRDLISHQASNAAARKWRDGSIGGGTKTRGDVYQIIIGSISDGIDSGAVMKIENVASISGAAK